MLSIEQKMERDHTLAKGMLTKDGKMWFNERYATMFITKVSGATIVGLESVKWKNSEREIIDITIEEAKVYIGEIIEALDIVYLGE